MQTFLRRLEILNFLRATKQAVSTDELVEHLSNAGYIDGQSENRRSQFRLVQRDMNFLLGEEVDEQEFENEFGLTRLSGNKKSQLWSLEPYQMLNYDFERMPAFMALALSVTQKHLKQVLPESTQQELQRVFKKAEEKLALQEHKLSVMHYRRLSQSVEFFQRGQKLSAPEFDMAVLDKTYRAILLARRVKFSYRSGGKLKEYDLHPFGVAIMLPKIYLVGVKEEDIDSIDPKDLSWESFRSFLVHKIEELEVSALSNAVPPDFELKNMLDDGFMDVLSDAGDRNVYCLKLKIKTPPFSNLLMDLKESPISLDQELTQEDSDIWLLTASVCRTVQLRNWLLSLGSQATVLEPKEIREELKSYLLEMYSVYESA